MLTSLTGLALLCVQPQDPLDACIKELKTRRDDVEPELIHKIAKERSRRAMEALVSVYDDMRSIFMRREIIRALPAFDGVEKAEQPALEKLATAAASASDLELRKAAIESLGKCANLGNHYLARIVDSAADDDVRLMAMQEHVKRATKNDIDWYRKVWNPRRERQNKSKVKDKNAIELLEFEPIRELAFAGLAKFAHESEVVDALKSAFNPKIRRAALEALKERNSPKLRSMAMWLFKRVDIPGAERLEAAKILVDLQGAKMVQTFVSLAKKRVVTQENLRQGIARLIVQMNDDSANKKVMSLVGRGKPHEKIFALLATTHINDPKFLKRVRRGLEDRSPEVRRTTAETLAGRRDREALPALYKMLDSPRTPQDMPVAIEAITAIEGDSKAWHDQLHKLCKHESRDVRNAALAVVGRTADRSHLAILTESLRDADWTTRLVAIRALEALRDKASVRLLVERLAWEKGRMARIVADALWTLTGQPFGESVLKWQNWWKNEGGKFEVISEADLAKAEKQRELKRLKQRTRTQNKFFGIQIISTRVIFIIDTSGSMSDVVHGRFVGRRQASRIDVAKEELTKSIKGLDQNSLFNIYAFSFGIGRWLKSGIAASSEHTREAALKWVDRLGAGGPTNLYDTLKLAFEDPDVDTLYLLSDGEPTSGMELDPHRIREDVKTWNRHRRIKIHTIAIGGNLDVLEWLAKDSGGKHVRIR
ncbi:MAG: HEAT repeat domain-containing protein [Planctomycetota bacterium]